jgi:DNA-binding transcriptional MerR regulator
MLRHYDAIGLIPPAQVDQDTGYRRYDATQLMLLNQVVTLRDLGFSLQEIALAVSSPQDIEVLRRLFLDRRAALERQATIDAQRLRRIQARLHILEGETPMPQHQIELKPLPPLRLAELTAEVPELDQAHIGPAIAPLYDRLIETLTQAGITPVGPSVAYYTSLDDGRSASSSEIRVHAGFPVLPSVTSSDDWAVVELGPEGSAASMIHHGAMATIGDSWATLRDWVTNHPDLRPRGVPREVYLATMPAHDQSGWVTELQWPVDRI